MKKINNYIVEKLNLSKAVNNIHEEIPFSKWEEYLSNIGLAYEEVRESNFKINWEVLLKDTKSPGMNIMISKPDKLFFNISSVHLGDEYNDKIDKKDKFTTSFWEEGFDMKGRSYLFTTNNADLIKDRLEDIVNSAK